MRTITLSEHEYKAMNDVVRELFAENSWLGEQYRSEKRSDSQRFFFFNAALKLGGAIKHES